MMISQEVTDDEFVLSDEIQSEAIESPALCRVDLLDDSLALPCRSPRNPPVFYNMNEENGATLNAKSLDALLHAGHNTPQTASKADISWSSSLATPCTTTKCPSELNTEERKVFLPSDSAQTKGATQYHESSDELEDVEDIFKLSNESSTPHSRLQTSTSSRLSKRLFSPRTSLSNSSPMLLNSPCFNMIPNTVPVTPSSQFKSSLFRPMSPDLFSPNIPKCSTSRQDNYIIDSQITPGTSKVQKFNPNMLENTINISSISSVLNKTPSGIHKIHSTSELKTQEIISQDLDNSIKPLINKNIELVDNENQLKINIPESEINLELNQPKSPIIGKRRRNKRRRIRVENKTIEISTLDITEVSRLEKTEEITEHVSVKSRIDIPSSPVKEFPEEKVKSVELMYTEESSVQSYKKPPEDLEKLHRKTPEESSENVRVKIETTVKSNIENPEEIKSDLKSEEFTVKTLSDADITLDLNRPKSPVLNISRAAKKRRSKRRSRMKLKINTSEIIPVKVEENINMAEVEVMEEKESEKTDVLSQQDLELKELDQDVSDLISTIWNKNQPSTSKEESVLFKSKTSVPKEENAEFKTPISKNTQSKNKTPEIETNIPADNSFIGFSMTQIDKDIENASRLNIPVTPSPPGRQKTKITFSKTPDTKIKLNTSIESSTTNIIKNIKEEAAKKLEHKMIYPDNKIEQMKPELNISDLKQSAVLLEKAVLKPRKLPITIPVNQSEAVKFSDMVHEESMNETTTDDVEMLINLLDADEALFGTESPAKSTVTSTPFIKTKLLPQSPQINLSPIVPFNKDILPSSGITTPLTRKNKPHLIHKPLAKIDEDRPLSTTPLTSRLKDQPISVNTIDTPIENIDNFQGFATASGKKLKLSEKALLKAQQIFTEEKLPQIPEEIEDDILPPLEPKQLFSEEIEIPLMTGFSTASGKVIQPSVSAIEKSKQLFETEVEDITAVSLYVENIVDDTSLIKLANVSQVTTNSEDQTLVQLADNLMKSEINKTEEEACSIDEELIEQVNQLEKTAIINMTIKTEPNEVSTVKIEIKEESMINSKQIELHESSEIKIKEEDSTSQFVSLTDSDTNDKLIIITNDSIKSSQNSNEFKGFQTASDKKLSISEQAIETAKKMFDNLENTKIVKSETIDTASTVISPVTVTPVIKESVKMEDINTDVKSHVITISSTVNSLSTVKSETVKSLITVKSNKDSFEDIEMDSLLIEFCENNESAIKLEENVTPIQGFATASGRKLQVSEKALLIAKKKYDEISSEVHDSEKKEVRKRLSDDFNGTYSELELQQNKKTKLTPQSPEIKEEMHISQCEEQICHSNDISQGTMEAAEVLLDLLKYGTQTQKNDQEEEEKPSENTGVTEESRAVDERKFSDKPDQLKHTEEFQGFTTASGTKIFVSQETILEAKEKYLKIEDFKVTNTAPEELSNLENENTLDTHQFQGFATASGKKVDISEDAILAAKKRFAETDSETISEEIQPAKFQGFATASGKKVDISEDAILAAKKRFAETTSEEIQPAKFQCFATASSKKVDISEDAILAAKKRFAETEAETTCEEIQPPKFQGFATASGKKVDISEDAILAAKNRFAETTSEEIQPAKFQCFATGSDKKVDISEDAILAAKKRFAETEAETTSEEIQPPKFQGFATASGKKVDISKDAILAAKNRFAETETISEDIQPAKFQGFVTASGKKVDISEDAILAAKRKFSEPDQDNVDRPSQSTESKSPKEQKFGGFATASGRKVNISKEAILAAQKKFLDESEETLPSSSSASRKTVEISEESILEAKEKSSKIEPVPTEVKTTFQGFATASGNKVTVSEDAILAAKKRFADTAVEENQASKFQGFATASGNTVLVSEESIVAAKRRLLESEVCSESHKRKFEELDTVIVSETSLIKNEVHTSKKILLDNSVTETTTETQSTETQSSQSQTPKSPIITRKVRIPLKIKKLFTEAREKQKLQIQSKSKEIIKPIPSKILEIRRGNQKLIKLREIPDDNSQNIPIRTEVLNINSVTAQTYRFKCLQICTYDDGAQVIPNNSGEIGVEEIESAFLASPGVDPKLIPPGGWVRNHYRWIIWKLASIERRFPGQFMNYLSVENVMAQLKFRYDREVDLAQRPAIRRITEQDSSPNSKIILCVAEINLALNAEYIILTDNWYCIKTKIDEEMLRLIKNKKIIEGTKLIIHGAEFINKFEACHPLQQSENLVLKISTNSTRRARWDAPLGFYKNTNPLNITLNSVLPYGGLIGEMWCSVARVYPIMYAEHGLASGSKTVIRGERAEKTCAERYETQRQKLMDRIVAEEKAVMYKEKEKEAVRRRHSFSVGDLRDGETLCLALESDPDLHTSLTISQRDLASEYSREEQERWSRCLEDRIRERMKSELNERSVSMLLKLRLVPVGVCEPSAILTIWRCNPDIIKLVKTENIVIKIYNSTAAGRRNGELCINSIKNTKIIDACPIELHKSLIRRVTPISILDDTNFKPIFNEIDLVGVVSSIDPIQNNNLQLVTLCDATGYQVIICFWGGIDSQGLSQLLIPGVSISAINLQWRKGIKKNLSSNYAALPCLQASEYSQFSRDPNENYLKVALQNLRATLDPDITIKNLKKCLTPIAQKVQVEKMPGKDVEKRMSALARYGEPPPISPLPIPLLPKVLVQTFHPPTRIVDEEKVNSPPMSLSQ